MKKSFAQQNLNDLVFVMYNLKLRLRQEKILKLKDTEPMPFDDLHSDDEWITGKEHIALPLGENWLNILDRATKAKAREAVNLKVITRTFKEKFNTNNLKMFVSYFTF